MTTINEIFRMHSPQYIDRFSDRMPKQHLNQKIGYAAMFSASSKTLKAFAEDDKWAGGDLPGFFGVLHT